MVFSFPSKEDRFLFHYAVLSKSENKEHAYYPYDFKNLNWEYILDKAIFYKFGQAIYFTLLEKNELNLIPSTVRNNLRKLFISNLARNLNLKTILREILLTLNRKGLPVIVLKGASLLDKIYKNPGVREMWDIDLLVNKKDIAKGYTAIQSLGYQIRDEYNTKREKKWFKESGYHMPPLDSPDKQVAVEFHWDLIRCDTQGYYPFYGGLKINDFWDNGIKEEKIAGVQALVLKPEYLLLHISLQNIAHHIYLGELNMNNLRDIFYILEYYEYKINWDMLISITCRHHLKKSVYFSLLMVKEIFHCKSNEAVMRDLYPGNLIDQRFQSILGKLLIQPYSKNTKKTLSRIERFFIADNSYSPIETVVRYLLPPRKIITTRFSMFKDSRLIPISYLIFIIIMIGKAPVYFFQTMGYFLKKYC